ncbi:TraX family protein [Anaerococcus lactolyticus]|uniref:TraX family protein n=1 Tax=Anaerococcus lactolyticus TaxID=33032 RepID=UPI0023F19A15|nr:TraX family protein [Anaerococcus lactolyticus]
MIDKRNFKDVWHTSREHFTSGDLKIIACGAMFLSHLAQSGFLYGFDCVKLADLFTLIGRIAMPLFCFMVVQGIILSENKEKYLKRLFIFALISEIPFDLAFSDSVFNIYSQNVFFSLFLGALMVYFWERIQINDINNTLKLCSGIILFLAISFIARLFMTDYDAYAIFAIALLYFAKDNRLLTALAIFVGFAFEANFTGMEFTIPYIVYLSIPLILLYNGKRGSYNRWYFYGFYPAHLFVIYLLKVILF